MGERLLLGFGADSTENGCHGNRKLPLTYNVENNVSTLTLELPALERQKILYILTHSNMNISKTSWPVLVGGKVLGQIGSKLWLTW